MDESLEAPSSAGNSGEEASDSRDHEMDMRIDIEDEIGAELASSNTETSD